MGSMNAEGMAEAVREGMVDLRQAIAYHLTVNHYPPHPRFMVDVALAAITAANEDDGDRLIPLPDGVEYRDGRTAVDAWSIIESLHLDAFLDDGEPEWDDEDDDDEDRWTLAEAQDRRDEQQQGDLYGRNVL